jgi:CRISPR-associated protein Cmr1
MTCERNVLTFGLKALTDIRTGGVDKTEKKLHLTGIKGSIRWWYEALIRGLGYYACDPRSDNSCRLEEKKLDRTKDITPQVKSMICPACYVFGCTGWSSKFILRITEPSNNKPLETLKQIEFLTAEVPFMLHFVERKKFEEAEKTLLTMTLKLIVDYGAIGGRTVLKPSEDTYKNKLSYKGGIHIDYGLLRRLNDETGKDISCIPVSTIYVTPLKELIDHYLKKLEEKKAIDLEFPDLNFFWFLRGHYIDRKTLNNIVKRDPDNPKRYLKRGVEDGFHDWLGGDIGESKKIFSFSSANKCWGYTKRDETMFKSMKEALTGCGFKDITEGKEVLNEL